MGYLINTVSETWFGMVNMGYLINAVSETWFGMVSMGYLINAVSEHHRIIDKATHAPVRSGIVGSFMSIQLQLLPCKTSLKYPQSGINILHTKFLYTYLHLSKK
jgi:hypothetical protein